MTKPSVQLTIEPMPASMNSRFLNMRVMSRSLSLVAAAALLSACSVMAPSYERPALAVPDAWPAEIQVDARTVAAKPVDWNSFFVDERLRTLIQLALENNRDMRIATARYSSRRRDRPSQCSVITMPSSKKR